MNTIEAKWNLEILLTNLTHKQESKKERKERKKKKKQRGRGTERSK